MDGFERFSAGSGETRLSGLVRSGHPEYARAALRLDQPGVMLCKDRPKIKAGIVDGLFVKRFNLPGAAARFRRLFFFGGRPLHDLAAAAAVEKASVYTPKVLAALCGRYQFHRCDYLITDLLPETWTTADRLLNRAGNPRDEWERIADAVLSLAVRLHDAGIEHGDLNLRNLCASCDLASWGVIDLDGSVLHRRALGPAARLRECARIASSFLRYFPAEARGFYADDVVRRYRRFSGTRLDAGQALVRINYLLDRNKA